MDGETKNWFELEDKCPTCGGEWTIYVIPSHDRKTDGKMQCSKFHEWGVVD